MRRAMMVLVLLFAVTNIAFSEQVNVTTIRVWARVLDSSGHPVTSLRAEDFTLYDDNHNIPLSCFEEVNLSPEAASAKYQAPAKKFILFLDLYNTSQADYLYILPRLREFVNSLLVSHREVMIAGVLPSRKMGIMVPFTLDVEKIESALNRAHGNQVLDSVVKDNEALVRAALFGGELSGKGVTEARLQQGYQLAGNLAREEEEVTRFSINALEKFSDHLLASASDEPTVVLLISRGFSGDPGRRYFDIVDHVVEDAREQIQAPQNAIYHKEQTFDFRRAIESSIGRLNRLNVILYTINTQGLITTDQDIKQPRITRSAIDFETLNDYGNTLAQLAEETGGITFNKSQNFKLGFDNILGDLDQQYLLCYQAPAHAIPGQYHHIRIEVARPGTQVRHRKGYLD